MGLGGRAGLSMEVPALENLEIKGEEVWKTDVGEQISDVEAGPRGSYVYSTSSSGTVRSMDTDSGSIRWSKSTSGDRAITVHPNGDYVFVCGGGSIVKLDSTDGSVVWSYSIDDGTLYDIDTSPNGDHIYTGGIQTDVSSDNQELYKVNSPDGSVEWAVPMPESVNAVGVGPNGDYVYSGTSNQIVVKNDTSDGSEVWRSGGMANNVHSVDVKQDNSYVYAGDKGGDLNRVAVSDGSTSFLGSFSSGRMWDLEVGADGKNVLMALGTGGFAEYIIKDGKLDFQVLSGTRVQGVAAGPDGDFAYTGDDAYDVTKFD